MAKAKVRLFADAHFPIQIIHNLRRLGYDVKTVQQYQGTSRPAKGLADESILEIAVQERRAVITLDKGDFRKLHGQSQNHQGIVICKDTTEYRKLAKQIDEAIKDNFPVLGKLIHVPSRKNEES